MDDDSMDNDNICISTLFKTDDDSMDNDNIDISILFKMDDDSMDHDNIDISILFKTDDDSMDSDNIDISALFKMNDDSIDNDNMDISTLFKMDDDNMHNDNINDDMLDIIKMYDLNDNMLTREFLNAIKMVANDNGIDLITFIDMINGMSDDESTDRYSIDCEAAALACENRHYLEKHKASMDNCTTGKDTTDDETIDYDSIGYKVATLVCKNRCYLEKHKMYAYLDDAVAQLISFNVKNEATKIKPAEFFKDYFNSVHEGTHVLFREYSFISASLFNRLCVMKGIFNIYKPLFYKDDKLNPKEYHSLLQLVWPDFPFDVVQASFRSFETPEQNNEVCASFLEFFRAFKSSFCVGRFDYEENVINEDLKTKIERIVKLKGQTPPNVLEAYFLHTIKKGRNQKAIMASIISNLDSEFKRIIGFEVLTDKPAEVPLSFSGLKLPLKSNKKVTTLSKTLSTSHQVQKNAKQLPSSRCPSQTEKIDAKKKLSGGQGLQNAETVNATGAQIAFKSKQNVTVSQTTITNSQEQMDVKQLHNSHSPLKIKKPDTKNNSSAVTQGLKSAETGKIDEGKKSFISSCAKDASKTQQDATASSKTSSTCQKGKISVKGFPKVLRSPVTLMQIERVFTRLLAIQEESNKESAEKLSSAKSASKSLPNLNTFSQAPSVNFWGQVKVKKLSKSLMNIPLLQTEKLGAKNNLSSCQQKSETSKIETETSESEQNKTVPSKASSAYRRGQVSVKRFPDGRGPLQTKKFVTKSNATVRRRSEIPKMKTEKKLSSVSSRANDISKSKPNVTIISKTISANHPGKLGVKQLPKSLSSSVTPLQTKKKFTRKFVIKESSNKPAEKTRGLISVAKGASKSEPSLNAFYKTSSASFGRWVSARQLTKSLDSLNLFQTQKLDAEKKSLTCQQISDTAELKTEKKLSFASSAVKDTSTSMQNLTTSSKISSACQQGQVSVKQLPNVHHHLQTKKSTENQSTFGQRSETTKMKAEKERFFVSTVVKDTSKSKQNVINFSTKSSAEKQNHLQTKKSAEFRQRSETTKMKPEKERFFVSTVVKEASKSKQNVINFSTTASAKIPGQVNAKRFHSGHCLSQTVKNYAEKNSSAGTQGLKRLETVKIDTETFVSSRAKDDSKSKQTVNTFSKARSTSQRKPYKMKVINVAEQLGWTQLGANNYQKNNVSTLSQRSEAAKMKTEKKIPIASFGAKDVSKSKQNVTTFSKRPSTSHREPFKMNVINVAEQLGWTQSGAD
ncbi:UPF0705 protein C11orf49, partial [Araneus ventricosus]